MTLHCRRESGFLLPPWHVMKDYRTLLKLIKSRYTQINKWSLKRQRKETSESLTLKENKINKTKMSITICMTKMKMQVMITSIWIQKKVIKRCRRKERTRLFTSLLLIAMDPLKFTKIKFQKKSICLD